MRAARSISSRPTTVSTVLLTPALLACAASVLAWQVPPPTWAPGVPVAVSVTVDGDPAPLYPAPDGSGRFYLEAHRGSRYAVTLENRSGERLGAVLAVDGLNVISGAREPGRGRMYVLDPWQRATIQGWRTSLEDVRRFRFVDEASSYAARSGKANEKMGWIELTVYRERRAVAQYAPGAPQTDRPAAPPAPSSSRRDERTADAAGTNLEGKAAGAAPRAFPGTGWGERAHDAVVLVDFEPEREPCQRATLRYEYRPALVALGVLAPALRWHDRLGERDRAEPGFAQPPLR